MYFLKLRKVELYSFLPNLPMERAMKKSTLFFNFSFLLFCGLVLGFIHLKNYFLLDPVADHEVAAMRSEISELRMKNQMLSFQLQDFQVNVARLIEESPGLQKTMMAKNFTAVSRSPSSLPPMDMSSVLIQGLKVRFSENDFKSVVKEAERLVSKYPTSPYVVESYFFMAEAYFKMQKFEKVADVVEIMGEHYPDHILTGFILLRLGQIYEMNNKTDEAQEVYRVVQKEFRQAEIQNQVSRLIKD